MIHYEVHQPDWRLSSAMSIRTIRESATPSTLVQHWPFDGNANNAVEGGVDAVLTEATLTTDRFGNANCAYSFDGIDDKMIAENAANFGTSSFTANIWVCSSQTSGLGNLMRTDNGFDIPLRYPL